MQWERRRQCPKGKYFIRMADFTQESSQLELGMKGYLFAICIQLERELRIGI